MEFALTSVEGIDRQIKYLTWIWLVDVFFKHWHYSWFFFFSKGDGENIAGSNFSDLLIFVSVTFGNRLRNDRNSIRKISTGLKEEGGSGGQE